MGSNINLLELEELSLSDVSEDLDETNNYDIYDNLDIKYYPEPYIYIGEFILSQVVGVLVSYITNKQLNKNKTIPDYLELYYNYCKNTNDKDNYLINIIELTKCVDEQKLFYNCKIYAEKICNQFLDLKINYEPTTSIEFLNTLITKKILKLIKYSDLITIM